MTPLHSPSRLQVATRIHFLMLRELGRGIDVAQMLNRCLYARDVLLVCDACPGTDLCKLSQQFREISTADVPTVDESVDTGFQASLFAHESTGFGASLLPSDTAARPAARPSWFSRLMA